MYHFISKLAHTELGYSAGQFNNFHFTLCTMLQLSLDLSVLAPPTKLMLHILLLPITSPLPLTEPKETMSGYKWKHHKVPDQAYH